MDKEKQKKKEKKSVDKWTKCLSKSGRYYMFNTSNGESYWCKNVPELETENKESTKKSEDIEPPNVPPETARTPAQDRLKRLQSKIKENRITKKSISKKEKVNLQIVNTKKHKTPHFDGPTPAKKLKEEEDKSLVVKPPKDHTPLKKGPIKTNETEKKATPSISKPLIEKRKYKIPKKSTASKLAIVNALKELHEPINTHESNTSKETDTEIRTITPANSPNIVISSYQRGSANKRLSMLQKSLHQQLNNKPSTITSNLEVMQDKESLSTPGNELFKTTQNLADSLNDDFEPMDWEPSDLNESDAVEKLQNSEKINNETTMGDIYDKVNNNLMRLVAEKQQTRKWLQDHYYFVLDTNVLIEYLSFIDDIHKMKLLNTAGTIIYIPYMVLQELDKLKHRSTNESAKTRAVRAIKYLNGKFESNCPNIQVQSAAESTNATIEVTSPDDSIINCCLQVKRKVKYYIFLTEDVNMRNKAISNGVLVTTKSNLVQSPPKKLT